MVIKQSVKTFYKSHQIVNSHIGAERENLQTYVGRTKLGRAFFHKMDDTERAIMKLGISGTTTDIPLLLTVAEIEYNESILCETAVDSLICLKERGQITKIVQDMVRFESLFWKVRVGA